MEAGEEEVRLPCNQAEFEAAVIDGIAQMHAAVRLPVMEQYEAASVLARNGSRVGCFTHFAVRESAEKLPEGITGPLDGPTIRLKGLGTDTHLAGALLFLDRGRISMLECFAYGSRWPDTRYDFEICTPHGQNLR